MSTILVDVKKTQTENLLDLIRAANVKEEVIKDLEGFSVFDHQTKPITIEGKLFNTELRVHIVPFSYTHHKEKKTYTESNYNRVPLGFTNDQNHVFRYESTYQNRLDHDNPQDVQRKLTKMVNEFPYFSQDALYPFSVVLSGDKQSITITPHLSSPCYNKAKTYPFEENILLPMNVNPETHVIWDAFFPDNIKQTGSYPIKTNNGTVNATLLDTSKVSHEVYLPGNENLLVKEAILKGKHTLFPLTGLPYFVSNPGANKKQIEDFSKAFIVESDLNLYRAPIEPPLAEGELGRDGYSKIVFTKNSQDKVIPKVPTVSAIPKSNKTLPEEDIYDIIEYTVKNVNYMPNQALKFYIYRKHLSCLFHLYLIETNKTPDVPFFVDDIPSNEINIPAPFKAQCLFKALKWKDGYGYMFILEVLNGKKDTPNKYYQHSWRINHATLIYRNVIYPDFIRWLASKGLKGLNGHVFVNEPIPIAEGINEPGNQFFEKFVTPYGLTTQGIQTKDDTTVYNLAHTSITHSPSNFYHLLFGGACYVLCKDKKVDKPLEAMGFIE